MRSHYRHHMRLDPVALAFIGEDPARRHVVSLAIAALMAASAGATAASQIYSAKKTVDLNEKSIEAQRESDAANRAAQLTAQANDLAAAKEKQATDIAAAATTQGASFGEAERARQEQIAYQEKARAQALEIDKARYDAYVAANQPSWNAGARILDNLGSMARVGTGPTAAPTTGQMTAGAGGVAPAAGGSFVPAGLSGPFAAPTASPTAPTSSLLSLAQATQSAPTVDPTTGRPLTTRGTVIASAPIRQTVAMPSQGTGGMSLMDLIKQALAQKLNAIPAAALGSPGGS